MLQNGNADSKRSLGARVSRISPIENWEFRRLFVTPGSGWQEVVARLRREIEDGLGSEHLVELASRVSRLCVGDKLYASTCMFNLVVSDTWDFRSGNGLLHIGYNSSEHLFWLHHIGLDHQQEYRACPKVDVMVTFLSLVQKKFMIGVDG